MAEPQLPEPIMATFSFCEQERGLTGGVMGTGGIGSSAGCPGGHAGALAGCDLVQASQACMQALRTAPPRSERS
eukprot:scaffold228715_cov28-Tisochrysis_lutea.AAC.2